MTEKKINPITPSQRQTMLIKKNELSFQRANGRNNQAPEGIKLNQYIQSSPEAELKIGNALPLKNIPIGKAGRTRWLNRRPVVRGVAKNPVDHPHGGGEGKTSGGRPSVSPQ
ncbi:50S ribosomal protein L2, partial [Trichinella spiralis]